MLVTESGAVEAKGNRTKRRPRGLSTLFTVSSSSDTLNEHTTSGRIGRGIHVHGATLK